MMKNLPGKKKNQNIPVLIIIAIAVTFLVALYSCSIIGFFKKQAYSYVQQNAQSTKKQIDTVIDYGLSSIKLSSFMISKSLSGNPDILKTPEDEKKVLDSFIGRTPFNLLQYVHPNGQNNMNGISGGYSFSAKTRGYYIEGMSGKTGIWLNYQPRVVRSVFLDFYAPLYSDNKIAGVLVGGINSDKVINPLFSSNFYGKETVGILCDSDLNVITSNYKSVASGSNLKDWVYYPASVALLEHIKRDDETGFDFNYQGLKHIGCVAKLKNADWYLIQILPNSAMTELNTKSISVLIFLILLFCVIIIFYAIKALKERRSTEKMHVNIITALCTSYQNVYVVNIKTGEVYIYQLTERMKENYGERFAAGNYDYDFKLYEENEVYYEDKNLFDKVNEIEKIREILKNQKEFSFVYRVKSKTTGEKIHFYQCYFIKPENGNEFVVTFKNVDDLIETKEKIDSLMKAQTTQLQILSSISGIYLTLHYIDLKKDTIVEFNTTKEAKKYIFRIDHACQQLKDAMHGVCGKEYLDDALKFVDLETLKERMKGKKIISVELYGTFCGWFRASFINVESDADNLPKKVLFATQEINNEKHREEVLISNANTDELTRILNRHAYEDELREIENKEKNGTLQNDFVYVSLDVNGLKNANDTLGHAAGDELLRGATECIKKSFGNYGKIFRTGGDEFQVIMFASDEQLKRVEKDFDKDCENWSGKLVKSLSVSYGVVTKAENPKRLVAGIIKLADKRMYKAKSAYYSNKGVDRRGTRDAIEILCQAYTKILKIDLTRDLFSVIQIEEDEKDNAKKFNGVASKWISTFGNSDFIDRRNRAEFLRKTDFENLKKRFNSDEKIVSVHYRRKIHGEFKNVQLEIIKSPEYAEKNEVVYFFVREA